MENRVGNHLASAVALTRRDLVRTREIAQLTADPGPHCRSSWPSPVINMAAAAKVMAAALSWPLEGWTTTVARRSPYAPS